MLRLHIFVLFLSGVLLSYGHTSVNGHKNIETQKVAEPDTAGLGDFSFDALIGYMDEAERQDDEFALGSTLAYLDQLFEQSIDPDHPQVIGGGSSILKKNFDAIPSGDIPVNVSEFQMPIRGRLSSRFGYRRHSNHHHNGIDIAITKSDTVCAAFPGKIVMTGNDKRGYGYYIVMSHPNGLHTLYAHLEKFLVVPGEQLTAGTPMAIGGKSGNSTGKHLHFEIRYNSIPVNPASVINLRTGRPREATFIFNKEEVLEARAKKPETDTTAQASSSQTSTAQTSIAQTSNSQASSVRTSSTRQSATKNPGSRTSRSKKTGR